MPINTINYKPTAGEFCHDYGKYGYPGKSDYYLCRDGYVVAYNCTTKQPNYSLYRLTANSVSTKLKRKDDFEPDLSLPKQCRSELSDWRKSGYDRGHLAPYASMDFSRESANQSFLLSNMSPQKAGLNRQGWSKLESFVRFWAKSKGELYVYTGVIFKGKKPKTIGKSKVAVPSAYYKVIYAPKQNEVIAFIMPNKAVKKSYSAVNNSRVSVKEVEQRTGFTFFNNLTNEQKSKVSKMWRTSY
ncbi:DNA/RNA non-specific endonuclease [Fangia hongkongensis]|nr:DNA/RNA non-specific endonuclease [Fangia hongkongensis]